MSQPTMPEPSQGDTASVDLRLEWEEVAEPSLAVARDQDHFDGTLVSDEGDSSLEVEGEVPAGARVEVVAKVDPPVAAAPDALAPAPSSAPHVEDERDGLALEPADVDLSAEGEGFESQEERAAALEEALAQAGQRSEAVLERALGQVRRDLLAGALGADGLRARLEEIGTTTRAHLARWRAFTPVDVPAYNVAVSRVCDALCLFQEVSDLLAQASDPEADAPLLEIAGRLLEQASAYLIEARSSLLEARPAEPS